MRSIVTGAARGLGEGIAARLAADGAQVALVDIDHAVRETAERIGASGAGAVPLGLRGDVSSEDDAESVVAEVLDRFGGVDLLVNNAGVGGPSAPVVDLALEEFRRVLEVNLVGTFLMARACARWMSRAGTGGCIVNIGSIFGQQGTEAGAAYCASKGGVALFTHSLALELAPFGIRVNTIAPGNMMTEMHVADLRSEAERGGGTLEDQIERVRATVPLRRHGTGQDVAGAVAWLASSDASYVTGQTIGVNGGVLLT